ncbi:hypothetical protein F5876DRAFT_69563 [Lentinula aff. lateritia]|uniref:Uncharacterized protein n=1 Tax=Lentinula aff. lateritia TaxID=2804960 RepID=A0ACC1TM67_9AGAR|nr:hypothetical protein F5876DRAFT_69563 [Lentinula aff. lateritia]
MFVLFYKDEELFDGYSSPFFCNVIGIGKSSESAQGSATGTKGGSELEAAASGETVELTSTMTVTMTLTHTMTPTPTPTPVTLEKVKEEPEPQYCGYCTSTDEICKRYGSFNLARSRAYDGPNARLKRVLRKLRSGQKIKIGIIGGSVSAGHGLPDHRLNWSYLYAQYIRETFGSDNVEVELINGSVGATVSDYMETCFLEHITEDVDLVIIELAINDMRLEKLAMGYENLIRAVFALPNRPAIVNLQIMALMFPTITMGGDLHTAVAQYYDTPIVSVRNVLLPHILRSTELNPADTSVEDYWYYHNDDGSIDLRHLGITGHRMLADLLISFTSRVACEAWREEQQQHAPAGSFIGGFDWSPYPDERLDPDSPTPGTLSLPNPNEGIDVSEYIPRESLFQKFDHTTNLLPARPFCQISAPNAKHPLMPLPQPVSSEGHDASDMSQVPDPSDSFALWSHPGNPGKVWLTGRKPGVKVSFAVQTSSLGRVRVTYLKSESYGLGSVWCWIDGDREKGERLDGWWPVENINVAHPQTVAESLSPGDHILTCEILKDTKDPGGGTEFRIVAIDAL